MANPNSPKGLTPVKHIDGSPYNDQVNEYYVPATDATALFIGDVVKSTGACATDGTPIVTAAAAGDTVRGVVVGVRYVPTNLTLNYHPASTAQYILVSDDPYTVYLAQEDSVGGAISTTTGINKNYDVVVAAGSTVTGISGTQIDSSTATAATANVRVLRLNRDSNNVTGVNAVWEIMINEHELKTTTGTA